GYIQAVPESFGLYSLSAELLPNQPVPLIEFSVAREKTIPNYGYLTHPESDIKFFLQHAPWQFNPANTVTLLLEIAGIGPEEAAQFRTPLQAECEKRAAEYISAIPAKHWKRCMRNASGLHGYGWKTNVNTIEAEFHWKLLPPRERQN
ncbi:hypothetical protein, partial [Victivallis vadensis]|uniref:hypothetical protein n=1 Tax=Victivallis vadensis TaxID=172901 RepID=UPI00266C9FDC